MRETYVQQLIRVQRSVPVCSCSNWGWDDCTSCVNGLPHVCSINSPCDLFDQSRGKSFFPKRFMNTQKVDLSHFNVFPINVHMDRDCGDESEQLILLSSPHTKEPIFIVTWRKQGPLQEFDGVIEPEHIIVIFYVILGEQLIYLVGLVVISDIHVRPKEAIRDSKGFVLNFTDGFFRVDLFVKILVSDLFIHFWHWLSLPEIVGIV